MKFNERITLIKAGYTKQEIAEMEKETVEETQSSVSTKSDDRLDLIAQSIVDLNNRINEMNIINSADESGGGEETQTNIFDELRGILENNPNEEGGN